MMTEDMGQVVWESTVDGGTYDCRVLRTGDYTGELVVTHVASKAELLREAVSLSYRAIFGPDVDDLAAWQQRSLQVIDEHIAKQT